MRLRHLCALVSDQSRFHRSVILLAVALVVSAPSVAAEIVTVQMGLQVLDLDAGTVADEMTLDPMAPTDADVKLAYNADRTPHAVVFPFGDGVELAFVASTGFDDISSADVPNLVFSTEPTDLPFSANDCVVIRTALGTVFKLGNATESGMSVTFNYELL